MYPNFVEEKKLWRKGFGKVAGLDEAGRGPLAGPVVACAVLLKSDFNSLWKSDIYNIKDSKQLSAEQRERFYKILTRHPAIEWGVGVVSEKVIDRINILEATKLAMIKAIKNLSCARVCAHKRDIDFLILDGNFTLPAEALAKAGNNPSIPQKSIVKADEKVFSCACASVIAKVTRDRMMLRYDKKYPCYGFAQNKGYPTEYHRKMLKKHGFCKIHRKTFRPVSRLTKT